MAHIMMNLKHLNYLIVVLRIQIDDLLMDLGEKILENIELDNHKSLILHHCKLFVFYFYDCLVSMLMVKSLIDLT